MCKQGETISFTILNAKLEPRLIDVDKCISEIVRAFNAMGIITVASCCGHGKRPGNIALADGREIIIAPDFETGRKIDSIFPPLNPIDGEDYSPLLTDKEKIRLDYIYHRCGFGDDPKGQVFAEHSGELFSGKIVRHEDSNFVVELDDPQILDGNFYSHFVRQGVYVPREK